MNPVVTQLLSELEAYGLNLWGFVGREDYDRKAKDGQRGSDLAPECRSVLVVGNGGRRLWEQFENDLRQRPSHLRDHDHPLDAFVARSIGAASQCLVGHSHRWIHASNDAPVHIDFRTLAVQSGLGAASRLGLVIHPVHGPWMALRSACFLPFDIPTAAPVEAVCDGCDAPCASACPGEAFDASGWRVARCAEFHTQSDVCIQSCASRNACPVGSESVYSGLQQRYHYNRNLGRVELAQALEIEGDCRAGVGPLWGKV